MSQSVPKKEAEEAFLTIIQRIQRQYNPANSGGADKNSDELVERPPDEAANALGRHLAVLLVQLNDENQSQKGLREKALLCLTTANINPSIIHSFFTSLLSSTDRKKIGDLEWLQSWLIHAERSCLDEGSSASMEALSAITKAYSLFLYKKTFLPHAPESVSSPDNPMIVTFQRLQSSAARMGLAREIVKLSFSNHMEQFRELLSPLLAATVLSIKSPVQESILILENIWRESWAEMTKLEVEDFLQTLSWMTRSLDIFLLGIASRTNWEDRLACKEMASRWLVQVVELGSFLAQSGPQVKLAEWLMCVLSRTLPRLFAVVPTYRISLEPTLMQAHIILERLGPQVYLKPVATLRLAAVLLSNPLPQETGAFLKLFSTTLAGTKKQSPSIHIMLRAICSIFIRDKLCGSAAKSLVRSLAKVKTSPAPAATGKRMAIENAVQFLDGTIVNVGDFGRFLSQSGLLQGSQFSGMQQMGALTLGIGLLGEPTYQDHAYSFLKELITKYPHIGVTFLPVLVDSINAAAIRGDDTLMLGQIRFLCETVVQDAQCAREIWNLLGVELMKEELPVAMRSTVIRLFPEICAANKRLYKRVIETLGNVLADCQSVELRLAVISTISDLAKEDRIRDVTDVIGWIQGFIVDSGWISPHSTLDKVEADGNSALVHYALLSLHHLLVAQELDFDLVVVVLKKRLCAIHDLKEVSRLPPLVLESLILLLGDGECEDNSEDDEDALHLVNVSAQVSKSVDVLIALGLSGELTPTKSMDSIQIGTILRCRRNIYTSLAGYSMDALGIDEEGIQAVARAGSGEEGAPSLSTAGLRYQQLKDLISEGIKTLEGLAAGGDRNVSEIEVEFSIGHLQDTSVDTDVSMALESLLAKLLLIEEEILGSTLWQKKGYTKGNKRLKSLLGEPRIDTMQAEALPTQNEVQLFYNKKRCTSTALAVLLCYQGKPMSLLNDLAADIVMESSDPLVLTLTVQAWMNATKSTLTELIVSYSSSEGLVETLSNVREWKYSLDSPDNMFLALICFALQIPEVLGPYGDHSHFVNEICEEVWQGYDDNEFENEDVARLTIGLLGVCYVHTKNMKRVEKTIDILESSISGYGGGGSFGAFYGLGVIAQAVPSFLQTVGEEDRAYDQVTLIGRIVSFLIGELADCMTGTNATLTKLIHCIKQGEISPEIIDSLTALGKKPLRIVQSKLQAARSLFISFALCLPTLTELNEELLLGIYCLLENLPWGSGKGIALPSVLHACKRSGLFEKQEIEKIYAKYAKIFEEGIDQGVEGLDDIFFAVTGTVTKAIPDSIRRFLVGNKTLFDEDGRAVSLLAAVVSLCSVPCLGSGATSFNESAQLLPLATKEDIGGVKLLLTEAASGQTDSDIYPQVAILLTGFLTSMSNFVEKEPSTHERKPYSKMIAEKQASQKSHLPSALGGTILEVVVKTLSDRFDDVNFDKDKTSTLELQRLLSALESLSLPGQFAKFLEHTFPGNDDMKTACTKLLVSQISGRPRAVHDGREYIELALRISKMPVGALKSHLGQGDGPAEFVSATHEFLRKFPSDELDDAVENIWRFCINQIGNAPTLACQFLLSFKIFLQSATSQKGFSCSPKTLTSLRRFLVTRVFAGIRDAPWTATNTSNNEQVSIVESYASCLSEIPTASLRENDFFSIQELDGFNGEALRSRCAMLLVQRGYFPTPADASTQLAASLAWVAKQLVAAEDMVFTSTLLHVACSIAAASEKENRDRKREHLLSFLDNLLLMGTSVSFVGLQVLGILVGHWNRGVGSDGELSLMCVPAARLQKWDQLAAPTLQAFFQLLVHDLPFNLAAFCKKERIEAVVFNRLWRTHEKWCEQNAEQETVAILRKSLICCATPAAGNQELTSLVTLMLI